MVTVQQKERLWFHEIKSIVRVQRIIQLEYRNCQSPSKNFINHRYEKLKGTGNVNQLGRLSLLDCSYQLLMQFYLGYQTFRYSSYLKEKKLSELLSHL
ncbi:hypothetical protein AVEN_81347-1 [Araneus ventricosus]|uniref:Uncharacterized protein n=1 Tax=Araneus ventricosus TaxID=182803 RepID=A0A4Y2B8X9_ARAVE|nr:hypothetical protein AVEN_81347-1 [Araneus ventricosus]